MMRKLTGLFSILLLILMLTACSGTVAAPTEPTEPEPATQRFTLAPKDDTAAEPEWCPLDCELSLTDESGEVYATAEDFLCFAIVGSSDEEAKLLFKPTDEAAKMLSVCAVGEWRMTLAGEDIGTVVPSVSFDEFSLAGSYDDLCVLATTIRGL